uniref:Uncharacterized protein n=1 Tax=Phenylobacterium glaciei TaxID=2803784 RepID=A0A974P1Z6_9CAUL|nr:hypothetical protein JKL49_16755 [Phenylobacterium glaciei]
MGPLILAAGLALTLQGISAPDYEGIARDSLGAWSFTSGKIEGKGSVKTTSVGTLFDTPTPSTATDPGGLGHPHRGLRLPGQDRDLPQRRQLRRRRRPDQRRAACAGRALDRLHQRLPGGGRRGLCDAAALSGRRRRGRCFLAAQDRGRRQGRQK